MSQVSWTRILQRAGDEIPSEGASIIRIQDRVAQRAGRQPTPPTPPDRGAAGLEAELQSALDRAAQRGRAANPPRPAPYPRSQNGEPARRYAASSMQAPALHLRSGLPQPVPPLMAGPRRQGGSGARNLIAISLSVAVVAFAYYRISAEWTASRTEKSAAADEQMPATRPAAAVYGGGTNQDTANMASASRPVRMAGKSDDSVRIELRPTIAPEAAKEKAPARSAAPTEASLENEGEQAMLRRGHELMERGHISGARLVFEHLADQKSALGAFALAQSYDPRFLASLPVQGVQGDEMQAAYWYLRASELGTGATANNSR